MHSSKEGMMIGMVFSIAKASVVVLWQPPFIIHECPSLGGVEMKE